eukprot:293541-Pyramimonas_sp.AAC.1
MNKALKLREKKPTQAMKSTKDKKPMKAVKEKDAPAPKKPTKSPWRAFVNKEHGKVYKRALMEALAAGRSRAVAKVRAQEASGKRSNELREERAAGARAHLDGS